MSAQKIDTRASWAARNPILLPGEIGFESDTGNEKVGDGKLPGTGFITTDRLGIGANFQAVSIKLRQQIHQLKSPLINTIQAVTPFVLRMEAV
jgi:hypothetical protein